MKKTTILATVVLLLAANAVSLLGLVHYKVQSEKHYEAACHMSDVIRCYSENLRDTMWCKIEDYGCFEEICGIYLWDDAVCYNPVKLEEYVWAY